MREQPLFSKWGSCEDPVVPDQSTSLCVRFLHMVNSTEPDVVDIKRVLVPNDKVPCIVNEANVVPPEQAIGFGLGV